MYHSKQVNTSCDGQFVNYAKYSLTAYATGTVFTACEVVLTVITDALEHCVIASLLCRSTGVKQSGVALGDVILPPWAKGDPREFVRAHREVSPLASSHIS